MTTPKFNLYRSEWEVAFPASIAHGARGMLFVDGENFASRYQSKFKALKKEGEVFLGDSGEGFPFVKHKHQLVSAPRKKTRERHDIYVWSTHIANHIRSKINLIRTHYYTSAYGDENFLSEIEDDLIRLQVEEAKVFKRDKKKGSKQVDISLTVDMLYHAQQGNYDVAILMAGDEDYVPLVEAVKREGRIVLLRFITDGLSDKLRKSVDHFYDVGNLLFKS